MTSRPNQERRRTQTSSTRPPLWDSAATAVPRSYRRPDASHPTVTIGPSPVGID